ncbi:MAG TPA: IucA/IucC family protein, partial [Micromonosporaceae bacterium]
AFVAVRREAHIGDDVPLVALPAGLDPARYTVTPVHIWQWHNVVRTRYADLIRDRSLVLLPEVMPAAPTAALRTLLLPPDAAGRRRYAKVSLDIQVTSTRRTISVASTRNGPVLSALVGRLLADTDAGDRVMLLAETAGCAVVAGEDRQRDLSAILRDGLTGRLDPGEVAVPGAALCARSPVTGTTVLAELVDRYARCRGLAPSPEPSRRAEAAAAFVIEYARLVLPPVLELATRHGIALEAHLQNCIPTFVDGVPHRLAVRDLAGIRIHPGRLRAGARSATGPLSAPVRLWPGSVVVTDDLDVMRAKLAYTALQAHLGEVVVSLTGSHGLAEAPAWAGVRSVVDEVYQRIGSADARGDHAFLTAPTVPHKALLRMRLAAVAGRPGDIYTRVENPLS